METDQIVPPNYSRSFDLYEEGHGRANPLDKEVAAFDIEGRPEEKEIFVISAQELGDQTEFIHTALVDPEVGESAGRGCSGRTRRSEFLPQPILGMTVRSEPILMAGGTVQAINLRAEGRVVFTASEPAEQGRIQPPEDIADPFGFGIEESEHDRQAMVGGERSDPELPPMAALVIGKATRLYLNEARAPTPSQL